MKQICCFNCRYLNQDGDIPFCSMLEILITKNITKHSCEGFEDRSQLFFEDIEYEEED